MIVFLCKNNEKMKNYSGRLKHILEEKQLSVADFCRIIGLNSPTTIHLIIKDNRKPSGKTVQRIVTAFPDITEKWLLFGIDDKKETGQDERTVTAKQVIDFIIEDIPSKIDQRDNQTTSILMDKLNDITELFEARVDDIDQMGLTNENELQKLKQTVLIMHKNNLETTKNIEFIVQQLNVYLKQKLK